MPCRLDPPRPFVWKMLFSTRSSFVQPSLLPPPSKPTRGPAAESSSRHMVGRCRLYPTQAVRCCAPSSTSSQLARSRVQGPSHVVRRGTCDISVEGSSTDLIGQSQIRAVGPPTRTPPHSHYGERRFANHGRGDLTAHLRSRPPVLRDPPPLGSAGSGTPRTSRRLCGSLAFEARIGRAWSTVASRLVRKVKA
jgi:hypothetical protein